MRELGVHEVPLPTLKEAAHRGRRHAQRRLPRRRHRRPAALPRASTAPRSSELHVTMPVSLRADDDPVGGNRITLMRFALPVGMVDPAERIAEIHDRGGAAPRRERSLPYTQPIAGGLNLLPRWYIGAILRHVDFLASNVPGIPVPVYVGGAAVRMQYAFGPTIGAGVNVTLMTYVDTCAIGINADTGAMPDFDVFQRVPGRGLRRGARARRLTRRGPSTLASREVRGEPGRDPPTTGATMTQTDQRSALVGAQRTPSAGLSQEQVGAVDALVDRAAAAARAFRALDQEQVDRIVEAMVRAGVRAAAELARLAIEETGFGVFEDKVVKNYVATEFLARLPARQAVRGRHRGGRRAQHRARRRADRRGPGDHAGDQPDLDRALQGDRRGQDPQRDRCSGPRRTPSRCCERSVEILARGGRGRRAAAGRAPGDPGRAPTRSPTTCSSTRRSTSSGSPAARRSSRWPTPPASPG